MATLRGSEDTSRGICEGELININEGSGFDKKDEDVPKEANKQLHITKSQRYFVTLQA